VRDLSVVNEYRKEVIRKMVQKRIRHQMEEERHNIKKMIGEKKEMPNGMMTNVGKP